MTVAEKDISIAVVLEQTSVVYRQKNPGSYTIGGKWVPGSTIDTIFQAAVQPTSSRELQDLPEGWRDEARYTIWAAHFKLSIDDYVIYDGDVFRIMRVWDREREGGFYRAILGQVVERP